MPSDTESVVLSEDGEPPSHVAIAGIVVAAGAGERLAVGRPKALIELEGRPLWRWAVDALRAGGCGRVVVAAPPENDVTDAMRAAAPDALVVPGGESRQESVRLGLDALADDPPEFVLVHDAARALTPPDVVRRVVASVVDGSVAVTPVVHVSDTIRQLGDEGSWLIDRHKLLIVQTPQGFPYALLTAAHDQALAKGTVATDDVTLAERLGHSVTLVDGDALAFKITTPVDLVLARALAGQGAA